MCACCALCICILIADNSLGYKGSSTLLKSTGELGCHNRTLDGSAVMSALVLTVVWSRFIVHYVLRAETVCAGVCVCVQLRNVVKLPTALRPACSLVWSCGEIRYLVNGLVQLRFAHDQTRHNVTVEKYRLSHTLRAAEACHHQRNMPLPERTHAAHASWLSQVDTTAIQVPSRRKRSTQLQMWRFTRRPPASPPRAGPTGKAQQVQRTTTYRLHPRGEKEAPTHSFGCLQNKARRMRCFVRRPNSWLSLLPCSFFSGPCKCTESAWFTRGGLCF